MKLPEELAKKRNELCETYSRTTGPMVNGDDYVAFQDGFDAAWEELCKIISAPRAMQDHLNLEKAIEALKFYAEKRTGRGFYSEDGEWLEENSIEQWHGDMDRDNYGNRARQALKDLGVE